MSEHNSDGSPKTDSFNRYVVELPTRQNKTKAPTGAGKDKVKTKTKEQTYSEEQAQAQLDSIKEMVSDLVGCDADRGDGKYEKAIEAIQDDPLSVQVRSDWYAPGHLPDHQAPAEFNILLCTGGPAVRIIGELSEHAEPESARLEHQDWGTPWTEYRISSEDEQALLTYCRQFYFGE